MDEEQKEALANFAKSTDVSIRALLAALEATGEMIEELRERVFVLEQLRPFIIAGREVEEDGEENNNSCEPTQEESNAN